MEVNLPFSGLASFSVHACSESGPQFGKLLLWKEQKPVQIKVLDTMQLPFFLQNI